ncbi:MAG TPA: TraB/GumN family protein [Caulobacteraceae bacterium]|jgi:hypothetical protein|nr:TraB/GumN family protein [Caulobacteraceae bacterium]
MRRFNLTAFFAATLALAGVNAARAEPALWKVQGPHATVWLFGTIHALKPGLSWRTARLDAALASADQLWLEIADADDPAAIQPLVARYGLDPAHPLSGVISAADEARLERDLKSAGIPAAGVQMMRPWMAGTLVEVAPMLAAGYDPDAGVDRALEKTAKAAGKPVLGLETAEQQVRYLSDMAQPEQIAFLESALDDADKGPAELDRLMAAWAAGDVDAIDKLMNQDVEMQDAQLYRRLIVERNQRFAARIAQLAQGSGTFLVAVGAAHLAGRDCVQRDLAKLGLEAVRQ